MIVLIRAVLAAILLMTLVFVLYPKSGGFTLARRIIIGISALLLVGITVIYEMGYTKKSELNRELLNAFSQNQTLICSGHEITSDNFTFVVGTQVFAHKSTGEIIFSIDNCEVK
ncbi:MAG: hypothetical protein LBB59_05930 [Campylobacteraceae bacterium]|jgi:hypothetical protein|nr:hypothetical protein [Campylobacteraceae bacterium]